MSNIIVTGAFGALGRAIIAHFNQLGHKVAAVDLAQPPAGFEADLLLGGIDLTDEAAVVAAYAKAAGQFGGIDALVNVAGGFVWETVADGSVASWDRMYRMNLLSAFVSTQAALPHLTRNGGAIVNIGAAGAIQPGTGFAPYAASKCGVRALTESLAEEMRGKGVRVNAVLPTIIDTPTNRADMPDADTAAWVRPEAAAMVIAFLISDAAGAVTGASIPLSLSG